MKWFSINFFFEAQISNVVRIGFLNDFSGQKWTIYIQFFAATARINRLSKHSHVDQI